MIGEGSIDCTPAWGSAAAPPQVQFWHFWQFLQDDVFSFGGAWSNRIHHRALLLTARTALTGCPLTIRGKYWSIFLSGRNLTFIHCNIWPEKVHILMTNSFFEFVCLFWKSVSAVILSQFYNFWRPGTETARVPSGLRVATSVWVIVTGYIRQTSCVHTKTFIFQFIKIQDRHIRRWRTDEKVLRVSFFTSQQFHYGSFPNQ